jgi:hypothetical protein
VLKYGVILPYAHRVFVTNFTGLPGGGRTIWPSAREELFARHSKWLNYSKKVADAKLRGADVMVPQVESVDELLD